MRNFRTTRVTFAATAFVTALASLSFTPRIHAQVSQDYSLGSALNPVPPAEAYAGRVPGVVYVQFREGYVPNAQSPAGTRQADPIKKIFREIGMTSAELFDKNAWKDEISRSVGIDRIYVVYYNSGAHPMGVVSKFLQSGKVESASPRYNFKLQDRPNDPGFSNQYYMQNIHAEAAWNITMGDSNIVIADVDAGVNYNHEDLKDNIKYNAGEIGTDAQGHDKRTNGIDDDGDGAVDNWRGWDTAGETAGNMPISPDNDPYPEDIQWHGANHGTLTTGCFGAVANNQTGISGVAPKSKVLAIKIGNAQEQLTGAYEGIHFAAAHGAKVINCSWGGLVDYQALPFAETFTKEITARGEVMVAAAGNYSINNDIQHFYPAYISDVLTVGATDQADHVTSFSHFGHSVDVFAPGKAVNSTSYPGNDLYEDVDGTSFSSPITAGIVALVMAKNPGLSPKAVQRRIIESCDDVLGKDRWLWWGRVNALGALTSPGHPALEIVALNIAGGGSLDKVDQTTSVSAYFKNFAAPGANVFATLLPGPGYTWTNFDPLHEASWPRSLVGTIDSQATLSAGFTIIRTGQISEGSINLTFFIKDGSGYSDTLHVNVPVTTKDGMKLKMPAPHATAIKQVDAANAWAGFGYYFLAHDPERGDSLILVSQYSKRQSDGTWSAPEDIAGGDRPVTTMDAVDAQHAWFGATAPGGSSPSVLFTDDGGGSWSSAEVSGVTNAVRSIHFFDKDHGILVGDANGNKIQTAVSADGGQSWTAGATATAGTTGVRTFYNGAFWNGDKGWFGTSNREVFLTTDKGVSWKSATNFAGTSPKEKNIMSIGFSGDNSVGYAAVRPFGTAADSAALYTSANGGFTWSAVTRPDPGLIPYSITFLPGTTTAIITTNMGVYKVTSPTAKWTYLGVPSSWDPRSSVISAAGTTTAYTISASSEGSGVVDYSIGSSDVHQTPETATVALQTAPNPATDKTTLYFSMPVAANVAIELRDLLGRKVSEVYEGNLSAGAHTLPFTTSQLAPGVYSCTVRSEQGELAKGNLVIVR
jgi:hypothetical protein